MKNEYSGDVTLVMTIKHRSFSLKINPNHLDVKHSEEWSRYSISHDAAQKNPFKCISWAPLTSGLVNQLVHLIVSLADHLLFSIVHKLHSVDYTAFVKTLSKNLKEIIIIIIINKQKKKKKKKKKK